MRKLPLLTLLLLIITALMLLSACGTTTVHNTPDPPTAAPSTAPPPTDTPAPTDTPVPVETPDDADGETETETGTEGETPAEATLEDILTVVAGVPGLEAFSTAIEQADLTEKLQSAGPFTVFVPSNRAFDELPPGVLDDPDILQDIMLYHIGAGRIPIEELITAGSMTSLLGDELTALLAAEGATIAGGNVLAVDFEASNGLIHILDTVLLPPDLAADIMTLYPSVAGEVTHPMQGNLHIDRAQRSPVPYNSTPPTSGPHFSNIVAWQVYDEVTVYEQLVHNLEDAGVIVYYQCDPACPDLVQQLTDLLQPLMDEGRHIVLLPNDPSATLSNGTPIHADMGATIAVTAWRKILKLDEFDAAKIEAFIAEYEGHDHHVRFN